MNLSPLHLCLLFSSALFCVGLISALSRGNSILVLLGVELMLNAANLNFIAFWRFSENPETMTGLTFALFSIAIAAAEAAVGLALIITIYRHFKTANVDKVEEMKG